MNIGHHVLLVVLWILFSVLHSVFASTWWKTMAKSILGKAFRFYRFYYSLFATANLCPILYFQFSIDSPLIWKKSEYVESLAVLCGIAGLLIMFACVRKYFVFVSGINAFTRQRDSESVLQTGGLHRYTRHPLYFGTLIFIWSIFLLFPKWSHLITCLSMSAYTLVGIYIEERKLILEFGDYYRSYARNVPMLIPRLFMRKSTLNQSIGETA